MAITEVIRVPAIKAIAPYSSLPSVGFHWEEMINRKPNSLNTGMEPFISDSSIPAVIRMISKEERNKTIFTTFSLFTITSP